MITVIGCSQNYLAFMSRNQIHYLEVITLTHRSSVTYAKAYVSPNFWFQQWTLCLIVNMIPNLHASIITPQHKDYYFDSKFPNEFGSDFANTLGSHGFSCHSRNCHRFCTYYLVSLITMSRSCYDNNLQKSHMLVYLLLILCGVSHQATEAI